MLQRTHKETPYVTRHVASIDKNALHQRLISGGRCDLRRFCLASSRDRGIALRSIGTSSRPLTRPELLLFPASMAASIAHDRRYRDLAGKVSDQILPLLTQADMRSEPTCSTRRSTNMGARDHHHVRVGAEFRRLSGNLNGGNRGARERVLRRPQTGRCAIFLVRERPVAFALGLHTASEVTSVEEFIPWHDIFLKFPQYRFFARDARVCVHAGALTFTSRIKPISKSSVCTLPGCAA